MGITKSQIFTQEQNNLAHIAKVLGHPARIAILEHIMKSNACICNDLVDEIGLAQATISQHLKESIPCIQQNFQGCITPHPNPGVHVVYMCPDCWEDRQKLKKKSGFRW